MEKFGWVNSVRAVLAVVFGIGLHVGLFSGKVSQELYAQIAMIVMTAYFVKRDKMEKEK